MPLSISYSFSLSPAYFNLSRLCNSSISVSTPTNKMTSPSPVDAPEHVLQLLSQVHKLSLDQEADLSNTGRFISSETMGDLTKKVTDGVPRDAFNNLMLDKFIALDEDKCQFMYQLILSTGATNIVEAGTSFGVSTAYLALAIAKTKAATGKQGTVIATEWESEKAASARKFWKQCGEEVETQIDLRVGDLLETLKKDLPEVDLLLLDSKLPCHILQNGPSSSLRCGLHYKTIRPEC